MRLLVEAIISEKSFGSIFSARPIIDKQAATGQIIRVRASGNVLFNIPGVGETWEVEGEVVLSAWGPQLEATSARRLLPSGRLIVTFLVSKVPGIGIERARRLWDAYESRLASILRDEANIPDVASIIAPDRPNLGPRLAAALVREWKDASSEAEVFEWLSNHGVQDFKTARRVSRLLGQTAVERLNANPYTLVSMVDWCRLDPLALRILTDNGAPDARRDIRRFVGAADSVMKTVIRRGSTAATKIEFRTVLAAQLGTCTDEQTLDAAIDVAIRNQAIISAGEIWRAPGCAAMETAVLKRLKRFLDPAYPSPFANFAAENIWQAICDIEASGFALHEGQKAAIGRILNSPLACLQGGAGVGKTHTIRAICDAVERMGGRVLLCALAGKAALKLSRSTGRLARTLARTLRDLDIQHGGTDDETVGRYAGANLAQLACDTLVVIDEASMIDLPSIHQILRHMPEGSRLLLVGDTAQLPPVGFGLIYHLLAADDRITSTISHVFRQAAETGIPEAATAIKAQREPQCRDFMGAGAGMSFIDASAAALANKVVQTYNNLGGHTADTLIVTATNAGPGGVRALNAKLHKQHIDQNGLAEIKGYGGTWFAEGEPVIYLRNRYDIGLFNGLMGIVEHIDSDNRRLTVQFDGEEKHHILEATDLPDLDLAYAVTCHKCQGSQARRVIIPIYRTRFVESSWLYTAITRAEEQVVLIGDQAELSAAARRPLAAAQRTVGLVWRDSSMLGHGAGKENRTPLASLEG